MGPTRDFFRSDFSTFWLNQPKYTAIWCEKSRIRSICGQSDPQRVEPETPLMKLFNSQEIPLTSCKTNHKTGMVGLAPKWVRSSQMYWNLTWKSPGFVPFGANLTHFGAKPTILATELENHWRQSRLRYGQISTVQDRTIMGLLRSDRGQQICLIINNTELSQLGNLTYFCANMTTLWKLLCKYKAFPQVWRCK